MSYVIYIKKIKTTSDNISDNIGNIAADIKIIKTAINVTEKIYTNFISFLSFTPSSYPTLPSLPPPSPLCASVRQEEEEE